jgi:hypothetical protein
MQYLNGCDVLAYGFLKVGDMEDIVYSAALWKLQLISYGPYLPTDSVGPKETWLKLLCSTSFYGSLPIWLEP